MNLILKKGHSRVLVYYYEETTKIIGLISVRIESLVFIQSFIEHSDFTELQNLRYIADALYGYAVYKILA